jgi:hypothetical protein
MYLVLDNDASGKAEELLGEADVTGPSFIYLGRCSGG